MAFNYNRFCSQVWEMETGQLVYQVSDAHGPSNEITAITTDNMGYRLVTGAYDGQLTSLFVHVLHDSRC